MVIDLQEYRRRKQEHHLVQRARWNSQRSVAVFSAHGACAASLPVDVTALAYDKTYITRLYADLSDEAAPDCDLPDDPGKLASDAAYMNCLYEQATLV